MDKFYLKRHDRQPYFTARAIGSNQTAIISTIIYNDTILTVASTNGFPVIGNIMLSDYISITYTGKTPTTFTGLTWSGGTSGQTFSIGTSVTEVIDLTGAFIRFTMLNIDGTIKVNRATANSPNPKLGDMEYRWTSNDVDTSGSYYVEFEITPASGDKFTFPSNPTEVAIVVIWDDLDNT